MRRRARSAVAPEVAEILSSRVGRQGAMELVQELQRLRVVKPVRLLFAAVLEELYRR